MRWLALSALLLPVSVAAMGVTSGPDPRQMRGIGLIQGGVRVTNLWLNSTTPTSWGSTGTPLVSGNEITDDNASGYEGKSQTIDTPAAGAWTASCFLKQGTTGITNRARLLLQVNGSTGTVACSFSDLTTTLERRTCTVTVGAAATSLVASVEQGTSSTNTGSFYAAQCQLENAPTAGARCDSGDTAATCEI